MIEHPERGEPGPAARMSDAHLLDLPGLTAYGEAFDGEFRPVKNLYSWDANGFDTTQFCGGDTFGAGY